MKIRPLSPISLIQTAVYKSNSENQLKDDLDSNTSMQMLNTVVSKNQMDIISQPSTSDLHKQQHNQFDTFTSKSSQAQLQRKSNRFSNTNHLSKKVSNGIKSNDSIDFRILQVIDSINLTINKGVQISAKQWDQYDQVIVDSLNETHQAGQLSSISFMVKKLNIYAMQQIEKAGNITASLKALNFCMSCLDQYGNTWMQQYLRTAQISAQSIQTPKSYRFQSNFELGKQNFGSQSSFGPNFPVVLNEIFISLRSLTMNNQGQVYRRKGQFQAALEIFNETLHLLSNAKRKEYLGLTYLNLSILYSSLGNHNLSLENANSALIEQQKLFFEKNYPPYQSHKANGQGMNENSQNQGLQVQAISPQSSFTNLNARENHGVVQSNGSTPKNKNIQQSNSNVALKINGSREEFFQSMEGKSNILDHQSTINFSDLYFYEEEREDEFFQQVNILGISYYNIAAEMEYFERWEEAHRHYEYSYTCVQKYLGDENCITLQFYEEFKLFQSRQTKLANEENLYEATKKSPQRQTTSAIERPLSQYRKRKLEIGSHQQQAQGSMPPTNLTLFTKESERGTQFIYSASASASQIGNTQNFTFSKQRQQQSSPSRKNKNIQSRHRSLHVNSNNNLSKEFSHNQSSFQQQQLQSFMDFSQNKSVSNNQTPSVRMQTMGSNKVKRNIVSASEKRQITTSSSNCIYQNFFNQATPKGKNNRIQTISNSQSSFQLTQHSHFQNPYLFQPNTTSNATNGNQYSQSSNFNPQSLYQFASTGNTAKGSPKSNPLNSQGKLFNNKVSLASTPLNNLQIQKANLGFNSINKQAPLFKKIQTLSEQNKQKFQFSQIDQLKYPFDQTSTTSQKSRGYYKRIKSEIPAKFLQDITQNKLTNSPPSNEKQGGVSQVTTPSSIDKHQQIQKNSSLKKQFSNKQADNSEININHVNIRKQNDQMEEFENEGSRKISKKLELEKLDDIGNGIQSSPQNNYQGSKLQINGNHFQQGQLEQLSENQPKSAKHFNLQEQLKASVEFLKGKMSQENDQKKGKNAQVFNFEKKEQHTKEDSEKKQSISAKDYLIQKSIKKSSQQDQQQAQQQSPKQQQQFQQSQPNSMQNNDRKVQGKDQESEKSNSKSDNGELMEILSESNQDSFPDYKRGTNKDMIKNSQKEGQLTDLEKKFLRVNLKSKGTSLKKKISLQNGEELVSDNASENNEQTIMSAHQQKQQISKGESKENNSSQQNEENKMIIYELHNKKIDIFEVDTKPVSPSAKQNQSVKGHLIFTLVNQSHLISSFTFDSPSNSRKQNILFHSFEVSEIRQHAQSQQPIGSSSFSLPSSRKGEGSGNIVDDFEGGYIKIYNEQEKNQDKSSKVQSNSKDLYYDLLLQLSKQISHFFIISPLMTCLLVESNPNTPNRLKLSLQNVGSLTIINFSDDQSLVNMIGSSGKQNQDIKSINNLFNYGLNQPSTQNNQNSSSTNNLTIQPILSPVQTISSAGNPSYSHNNISTASPKSISTNAGLGSQSNFLQPTQSNNQLALEQIDELEELKPILNHQRSGNRSTQSNVPTKQEDELSQTSSSSIAPIVTMKYQKSKSGTKNTSSIFKQLSSKKEGTQKVSQKNGINPIIKQFQEYSPINNLGSPFVSAYEADPTFTNYLKDITPVVQDKNGNLNSGSQGQTTVQSKQTLTVVSNNESPLEIFTASTPQQQLQQIQAIITHNKQISNQDSQQLQPQQSQQQQQQQLQQQQQQQLQQQQQAQQYQQFTQQPMNQQGIQSQQQLANNMITQGDFTGQIDPTQQKYPLQQYYGDIGQNYNQNNQGVQQSYEDMSQNTQFNPSMGYSQNLVSNNMSNQFSNNINNGFQNNLNNGYQNNGLIGYEENNFNDIQQQLLMNQQLKGNYLQQMLLPQTQYYQLQQNYQQYGQYPDAIDQNFPQEYYFQNNQLLQQQQQQQQYLLNQYLNQQQLQLLYQNQLMQQYQQQGQINDMQLYQMDQPQLQQQQSTQSIDTKSALQKDKLQQSKLQQQQSLQQEGNSSMNNQSSQLPITKQSSIQSKKESIQVEQVSMSENQTQNSPSNIQDKLTQTRIDEIKSPLRLDTQQSNNTLNIQKVDSQLGSTPVNFSRQTFQQMDSNNFEKFNIQNPMITTNNSLFANDRHFQNSPRSLTDLTSKLEDNFNQNLNYNSNNKQKNKIRTRASIAILPSLGSKQENPQQRRYSQFYLQTLLQQQQQELRINQESSISSKESETSSQSSQDVTEVQQEEKKDELDIKQDKKNKEVDVKQVESKIENEDEQGGDQNVSMILNHKDLQAPKFGSQLSPSDNKRLVKSEMQEYNTQNDGDCDDDYEENEKVQQQYEKDIITRVESDNENNFNNENNEDISIVQKRLVINNSQDISQIKHKKNDYESVRSDDWNEFKGGKQIVRNQSNDSNIYSYFSANQNISQINKLPNDADNFGSGSDVSNAENQDEDYVDLQKSGFQSTSQLNSTMKRENTYSQTSVQSNDPHIQMNDNNQPISDIHLKSDGQNSQTSVGNNLSKIEEPVEAKEPVVEKLVSQHRISDTKINRPQNKKLSFPHINIIFADPQDQYEDTDKDTQSFYDEDEENEGDFDKKEEEEVEEDENEDDDSSIAQEDNKQNVSTDSQEILNKKEIAFEQNKGTQELSSNNTNLNSVTTVNERKEEVAALNKKSMKDLDNINLPEKALLKKRDSIMKKETIRRESIRRESVRRESLRKPLVDENLFEKSNPPFSSFRSAGTDSQSGKYSSPEKQMQESLGSKKQHDLRIRIEDSDTNIPSRETLHTRGKSESLMIKTDDNRSMTPKIKEKRRDSLMFDMPSFQNQLQMIEQAAAAQEHGKAFSSLTHIRESEMTRQRRESIKNGIVPEFGAHWSTNNLQSKMASIEENNNDNDHLDSEGESKIESRRQSMQVVTRPKILTFASNHTRIHAIQSTNKDDYHEQQSPCFTQNGSQNSGQVDSQNNSSHQHLQQPQDSQIRTKNFTFDMKGLNDSLRHKSTKQSIFQFNQEEINKVKDDNHKEPKFSKSEEPEQKQRTSQRQIPLLQQVQQQQSSQNQNQSILSQINTPLSSIKSDNNTTHNNSTNHIISQLQSKNQNSNSNLDSVSPLNRTTPNHQSSKSHFSAETNNQNNIRFGDAINQNN